jgi:hypothetical protein
MARTVVVLGAGATRGADFRHQRHAGAPRSALDSDFFDRLMHVFDGNPVHRELARDVAACARELSVTGSYPTLEQVFTFVEAADRMPGKAMLIKGVGTYPPAQRLVELKQAIALQLGSSLWNPEPPEGKLPHYQCKHHHWLVDQLEVGDVIVSFNYDCLIDWSLRCRGGRAKWDPRIGYGWRAPNLSNANYWTSGGTAGETSQSSIGLLKLHGSLNWRVKEESVHLSVEPYSTLEDPAIIPPVWDKRTKDRPFETVWDLAYEAIREASSIVVIGYSMPVTDVTTQVLFRAARQGVPLVNSVCVVNPDESAAFRTTAVLREAMSSATRMPRARNWDEFRELDRRVWHS